MNGLPAGLAFPEFSMLFIGGRWVSPQGKGWIEVVSPVTEQVIARVPDPTTEDIDVAVAAARRAFDDGPWPRLPVQERAAALQRIADEVERRVPAMVEIFAAEIGAPLAIGRRSQQRAVDMLRHYAEMQHRATFADDNVIDGARVRVLREPVGVVAGVIPWNSPVAAASFKLGPALLAGCTIVLKPSPEGPLTTYLLAEAIEAAGLPDGVVSILPGGREVGEHLVSHPGVDKVAFTGSTAAGRRIMSLCGERITRVTLELGGKSAGIMAPDVRPEDVLPSVIPAGVGHSGQICASITRLLVPRSREQEYIDQAAAILESMTVGNPYDSGTVLGPVAMRRQRDRVEEYIDIGRAEGADVVTGGGRPAGLDVGYYVEPTLFAGVDNSMRVAREEIFGPVLCTIAYTDIDDAIRIANDSPYGLSGAVYTNDPDLAERVVTQVRTGQIFVNSASVAVTQPFGGYKESGLGREGGLQGLSSYQETKVIQYA